MCVFLHYKSEVTDGLFGILCLSHSTQYDSVYDYILRIVCSFFKQLGEVFRFCLFVYSERIYAECLESGFQRFNLFCGRIFMHTVNKGDFLFHTYLSG